MTHLGNTLSARCYPNPAANEINIEGNYKDAGIYQLDIIDLPGKSIYRESRFVASGVQHWNVQTSSLPEGVYFLRIRSAYGSFVERIVITN